MPPFRLPKSPVDLAWAEPLAKPPSQPPSPVSGTLTESRCDSRRARVLSYAIGADPDAAHQPLIVASHRSSDSAVAEFLSLMSFPPHRSPHPLSKQSEPGHER